MSVVDFFTTVASLPPLRATTTILTVCQVGIVDHFATVATPAFKLSQAGLVAYFTTNAFPALKSCVGIGDLALATPAFTICEVRGLFLPSE